MHDAQSRRSDPIRSRGQLELELARLAMRIKHACGQLTSGRLRDSGEAGRRTLADWFGELADEVIARTEARLIVYAKERLKALAARWRIPPGEGLQVRPVRGRTGHAVASVFEVAHAPHA